MLEPYEPEYADTNYYYKDLLVYMTLKSFIFPCKLDLCCMKTAEGINQNTFRCFN